MKEKMFNYIKKLIIGDLDDKSKYKQMMKRVDDLPKDYSFAFKQIQKYIYTVGGVSGDVTMFNNLNIFEDLLDLFEESATDERNIIDIIGNDVSKFCDEFISAYVNDSKTRAEKLNKEIMERFNKEEK